jgi:hypothetical protein
MSQKIILLRDKLVVRPWTTLSRDRYAQDEERKAQNTTPTYTTLAKHGWSSDGDNWLGMEERKVSIVIVSWKTKGRERFFPAEGLGRP